MKILIKLIKKGELMKWERSKCVFPKMGTKTHQLRKGEKVETDLVEQKEKAKKVKSK